ncbi:MAG: hypothetical protein U0P30_05310 [Vicinamibacterales bacterium]
MSTPPTLPRRDLLALAALLAATPYTAPALAATAPASGRPGDFDFLTGTWRIHHRRPKADGSWDEFDGEATCWSVLGGAGHIEELRIPVRDFSGIGIRLLDPATSRWNDVWVNGKSRVLEGGPGLTGVFENGMGTFTASDTEGGVTTIVRGVWDRITATSHRWRQGASKDGGATWTEDWFMDWTRVR